MAAPTYQDIKDSLRRLYLEDDRPWLVGFSGGKDSMMVASVIVETVAGIPDAQRKKPVAILCTNTLHRLLGKVDEFSESHRAFGLTDDLLSILKDDLEHKTGWLIN